MGLTWIRAWSWRVTILQDKISSNIKTALGHNNGSSTKGHFIGTLAGFGLHLIIARTFNQKRTWWLLDDAIGVFFLKNFFNKPLSAIIQKARLLLHYFHSSTFLLIDDYQPKIVSQASVLCCTLRTQVPSAVFVDLQYKTKYHQPYCYTIITDTNLLQEPSFSSSQLRPE